MTSFALNAHEKQGQVFSKWVWFEGTTALLEGQGVCFNNDYGDDAAVADARRQHCVELPSTANARYFAGVAARNYSAKSTGQLIEIYGPGSTCVILAKYSATLGVGIVTCEAGGTYAGYFRLAGFEGSGSAVPLQTVNRSDTAGAVLALLQEGPVSGLVENLAVVDNDAVVPLVGGVTYLTGGAIAGGDCTAALADATIEGLRKKFYVSTAITGNNFVLTLATGGIRLDGSTALATVTVQDADEQVTVESCSGIWVTRGLTGATEG